jgi:membrane protease YdiL (CAAX protease family)
VSRPAPTPAAERADLPEADLYGPASPFRKLPRLSPAGALLRQAAAYAAFGLLAAAVAMARRGALPPVGLRLTAGDVVWGLVGIAAFLAYNVLSGVLVSLVPGGRALLAWLRRRNVAMFSGLSPAVLLVMAVFAGVCEEVVFRGWLQPVLGLGATSVVFALAHFPPNRYKWAHPATWGMIAIYFPIGLGVGWLYLHRENLLAPILTHAVGDALGLAALVQQARSAPARADPAA